jgi:hypothetical protein
MAGMAEKNPFYISCLIRSKYPEKDFTTKDGLLKTLEFELHTPRTRSERAYAIRPYRSGEFPHTRQFRRFPNMNVPNLKESQTESL